MNYFMLCYRYKEVGHCMTFSDNDKITAMHIAVNNNQTQIVKYLLEECNLIDEADTAQDRYPFCKTYYTIQAVL